MGYTKLSPIHIAIKNGQLGRVSHQAIHGTHVRWLTIDNVKIHSFDVVEYNVMGCTDVTISDAIVGVLVCAVAVVIFLVFFCFVSFVFEDDKIFADLFPEQLIF